MFNVSPSAASRALSMAVDCFLSKGLYPSVRRCRNKVLMCVSFRKENSRRCPIFSHSLTNMSAFLFKHPGEATSKCQVLRMRPAKAHSKSSQADEGNMLLLNGQYCTCRPI